MYTIVIDKEFIEVHSDMCDKVFERKDEISYKNLEFVNLYTFDEVEEFLKEKKNIVFCEICQPQTRKYDEDLDDFYEEFDEDDDIDESRCDI